MHDSRVLGPSGLFGRRAEFMVFGRRAVRASVFERECIVLYVRLAQIVQAGAKRYGCVLSILT